MTAPSTLLLLGGCTFLVLGAALGAFLLATKPLAPRATLGNRGRRRSEALETRMLFSIAEPGVRYLAARLSCLSFPRLRLAFDRALRQSGDHLGISEDELLAMCVLSGAVAGAATSLAAVVWDVAAGVALVAVPFASLAPWLRIRAIARSRARSVTRSLPGVIDLVAMCMSAGLDFPGALRRITGSTSSSSEPIIEELRRVLQELDLGRTRLEAMRGLVERVPTDEVRELVNSVVQAEKKGSPLSRVLTIQAQTLRIRRSVAAEETAAEAALMLVGPMTLIFLSVVVLLLGPVILRFATGGFQPV